jgi:hypothetical protein
MKSIILALLLSCSGMVLAQNNPSVGQLEKSAGNLKTEVTEGVQQVAKSVDAPAKATKKAVKKAMKKNKSGKLSTKALKKAVTTK